MFIPIQQEFNLESISFRCRKNANRIFSNNMQLLTFCLFLQ